jgi:hypothetical protein
MSLHFLTPLQDQAMTDTQAT